MCDYNSDSSSMSFENVRRRRIPRPPSPKPGWDDEMPQHQEDMPDVLYRAEFRSSSGRLVESRQDSKPLDNLSWEKHGDKDGKLPVIEILTRISAPYPFGRDHGLDYAPPPPRDYNSSDSEDEDNDVISPGMNDNRKLVRTDMVVHSKHLQAALTAVVRYYPGFDRFHDKHKIEAPYQVLIHHREALEHFKHNQPSCHDAEYAATTAKHIDILLNFLAEAYSEQLALEAKRWEKPTGPTATFDLFWVLLKPGEIVYRKPQLTPYVLHSVTRMVGSDGRQNGYLVNMWNVAWGRTRLQRRMVQIIVPPWTGERAIDTLTIIPARFLPGGGKAMAEQQIKLGRTHWELAKGPAYREYDGSLSYKEGREGKITGRVIVDCEGFARFGDGPSRHRMAFPPRRRGGRGPPPRNDQLPQIEPRCTCHECARVGVKQGPSPWAGFDKADPKNASTLPPNHDLFFHVLGPQIPAFILSERRWGKVLVSGLSDVKSDQDAFKYLVLDPEIKLTVKAMIGKFASQDGKLAPWPSDFIKNKGEGRIFLLHGSPGVGKTCTAECAAELARRPLLALTSGDINTSMHADSVEDSLNYFLKLGERFGALVLLDEADVYLEQRHTRDLQRNGLVSVFLRALEYYKGVLFLTTNRVEAFDDAFTSRIHVALHYKRLGDAERARIWMHNFERLERDSNNKVFIPQSTKEFAFESPAMRELRWNGREIRNALQTAVALAETEALEDGLDTITVQDRHLKAVVRMSSGFKTFLSNRRAREYGGGRAPRGGKGRHGRAFCVPEDDDDDDDDDDIDNDEKRDTAESNEYDQTEETEESDN